MQTKFSFTCKICGWHTAYRSGAILHLTTCGKGEPIIEVTK